MKVLVTKAKKLCFAPPGTVVRLYGEDWVIRPEAYMVCAIPVHGKKPFSAHASNGLYSDERPLFLVNLETGLTEAMPHLSSRVEIIHDATVALEVDEP